MTIIPVNQCILVLKISDISLYAIIYFTMLDKIDSILQRECKLHRSDLLLVGVSGGPDSLCLLHIFTSLGYPIIAAHVNHELRPEADEEAQYVKQFAAQSGIEFISCQVDVESICQRAFDFHRRGCPDDAISLSLRAGRENGERVQSWWVILPMTRLRPF